MDSGRLSSVCRGGCERQCVIQVQDYSACPKEFFDGNTGTNCLPLVKDLHRPYPFRKQNKHALDKHAHERKLEQEITKRAYLPSSDKGMLV